MFGVQALVERYFPVAGRLALFHRSARWSGHPTGIRESSSNPSPFCSMTDPSNGTSIVALKLMCDLLHCHVSAAKSPRAATSSKTEKRGCSRSGIASSLMVRRNPYMGSSVLGVPSAAALATVSSSNHVGRTIFTPIAFCDRATLMFSRRRLWYMGAVIQRICPSMVLSCDSLRLKDAATLKPR